MLGKLKHKLVILYLFALGLFFVSLSIVYSVECGGTCYASGVCSNGVWYEGCEDEAGNLYNPNDLLGDCLVCTCNDNDKACDWSPSHATCTSNPNLGNDYICDYTPNQLSSSTCVDRDDSEALCTSNTCSASYVWTKAGEVERSYEPTVWEYPFEVETAPGDLVGTTVACCGDDSSEYFISTTLGQFTHSACCDSPSKCLDQNGICMDLIIEDTVALCTDGIDNNCDGLIDCQDPSCAGSISGIVKDSNDNIVIGAKVDASQNTIIKHTDTTQSSGTYQLDNVICGTYDMMASATNYVSSTKTIDIDPLESKTVDFTGSYALVIGTTCEDDCTYAEDNTIHKECDGADTDGDGAPDCIFYDETAKQVCDLAQPGWVRDYNNVDPECPDGNCEIVCAEGIPQPKVEAKAEVTCELENLLKVTKVVMYKGRLVRLNIVTCG